MPYKFAGVFLSHRVRKVLIDFHSDDQATHFIAGH